MEFCILYMSTLLACLYEENHRTISQISVCSFIDLYFCTELIMHLKLKKIMRSYSCHTDSDISLNSSVKLRLGMMF